MKKLERDVHVERYFPDVLAPAKEMKAIAAGEDPEFHLLYEKAWKWFANTFIFHTDLEGVERWESMLSLYPDSDATLDDRRAAIFLAINGTQPYTERSFKLLCDGMYFEDAVIPVVHPQSYTLVLNLAGGMTEKLEIIKRYARLIAPANLTLQTAHAIDIANNYYVGAVPRLHKLQEIGRLQGDTTNVNEVMTTVGIDIFALDDAGNVHPTVRGIKPTQIISANEMAITINKDIPDGVDDGIFHTDSKGNILINN